MEYKIIEDLKKSYGLICDKITPVDGGYLNQLWKVSTDIGDLLVKKYSTKRFSKRSLDLIEAALQRQIILEKNGVLCPFIWQCGGHVMRVLDEDIFFMVMDFCPGKLETPETVTTSQMRSLGNACALMKKAFSQLPEYSVYGYPIDDEKFLDSLWDNFHSRMREDPSNVPVEYRKALVSLEPVLNRITTEFLRKLPKGIAHEDFHSSNIMFNTDSLSAIVDFDRNCYNYISHDIGRAILSFALNNNKLDIGKINAFIEGYSQHLKLTLSDIADALRISWCIETKWWIQPEFFTDNQGKAARFRDEILWLTEHWFEIDSLLCI